MHACGARGCRAAHCSPGAGPVFLLNALTFVVPIAVLLMIGRDGSGSPGLDRADRSLRAGPLRYVFGRPDVVMVLMIMFFGSVRSA